MKIKINTILQYLCIYIMLLIPGSCFFSLYIKGNSKYYIVFLFYVFLIIYKKKYRKQYILTFLGVLLAIVAFQRILSSGVGLLAWLQFATCLLSVHCAFASDTYNFIDRTVKLISVFAFISLLFWGLFSIFPLIAKIWPATSYLTQTTGTVGFENIWHGKGLFLYSYLELHSTRNCGIYTEPGVYQIVLNAALFMLLFWREKIRFKKNKYYSFCLTIIILSIISCQSTTGYIGMVLIFTFYYLQIGTQDRIDKKTRKYLFTLILFSIVLILIEYSLNGTNSILYKQVIEKLFGDFSNTLFDITNGSGRYRLGTIIVSITSIIQHPLGVGYDTFNKLRIMYGQGLVAASLLSFAAIYGIFSWLIVIIYVLYPVFKKERRLVAILFLLIFVNTTLAQTHLFYPGLMIIPIYLAETKNDVLGKMKRGTRL